MNTTESHSPAGTEAVSEAGTLSSTYFAYDGKRLIRPGNPNAAVPAVAEFVHDAFRSLVMNPRFVCVGAKSAVNCDGYRFGLYDEMGSSEATLALGADLYRFIAEQASLPSEFTTFAASFQTPIAGGEQAFERRLWAQLQRLHDLDYRRHAWDPTVSSDPSDPAFSFSFGGRAWFVVGLHAASSRWSRRFAWPTLIFNTHAQFERLREQGRFTALQRSIRSRDRALQGTTNPTLSSFGELSEARQYSGRAVDAGWNCPFHVRSDGVGA